MLIHRLSALNLFLSELDTQVHCRRALLYLAFLMSFPIIVRVFTAFRCVSDITPGVTVSHMEDAEWIACTRFGARGPVVVAVDGTRGFL